MADCGRGRGPAILSRSPVTLAILALNVAIWSVMALFGSALSDRAIFELGVTPARITGVILQQGAWVPSVITLVTALFLHRGWVHLLMNALFLIVVAPPTEAIMGARRFAALYFVGGVAGNIAQTLVETTSSVPIIGASGAISAVFGAYLMRFAARRASASAGASSELAVAARFALAWAALQALVAVAVPDLGIAVWAHIGGLLTGLAIGAAPRDQA